MVSLRRDPLSTLRAIAQGEDPNAPIVAAPEIDPDTRRLMAEDLANQQRSETTRAFRQGVEGVRASGVALRGLSRDLLFGDSAGALADYQESERIQAEAQHFGPRVQQLEDIGSVGDALGFARNMVVQQVPNMALTVAGGGVGGFVGKQAATGLARRQAASYLDEAVSAAVAASRTSARTGAQLRGAAKTSAETRARRVATENATEEAARRLPGQQMFGTRAGQAVGAAVPGTTLQAQMAPGIVLDEEGEGTQQERAGKVALGAVATGALEALPVMALLRRFGLAGEGGQVAGSLVSRIAQQAARQGTAEAATEVAQTAGERLTHKWVKESVEVIGPESFSDYLNAAAGGFIGGAAFGAPAGLRGSGRDSDAAKNFRQSFGEYMDKVRPRRPDGPTPVDGTPVAAGVRAAATAAEGVVDRVAAAAGPAVERAKGAVHNVAGRVADFTEELRKQSTTEHSFAEVFDAKAYGFRTNEYGQPEINFGVETVNGIERPRASPMAEFADPARARALQEQGYPVSVATLLSAVPDEHVARLGNSGAAQEALKLLMGADPETLNETLVDEFQNALPDRTREIFNRTAHTFYRMQQAGDGADISIATELESGADVDQGRTGAANVDPEIARDDSGDRMDEQVPLRVPKELVADWRANEGKPIPRGTPANTLIFVDQKGTRRGMSGASMARMMQIVRQSDPQLQGASNDVLLAEVMSDFVQQGYRIEPESIGPMTLGKNARLTPAQARSIREGLAPTPPREGLSRAAAGALPLAEGAMTPRSTATVLSGRRDERALDAEYGQRERVDEQRDELADMLDDATMFQGTPFTGRPSELQVNSDERVSLNVPERAVADAANATVAARRALEDRTPCPQVRRIGNAQLLRMVAHVLGGEGARAMRRLRQVVQQRGIGLVAPLRGHFLGMLRGLLDSSVPRRARVRPRPDHAPAFAASAAAWRAMICPTRCLVMPKSSAISCCVSPAAARRMIC